MCRLRIWLAVATIGFVVLHAFGIQAAESETETPAVARLERLKSSELLLKPPQGLPGGFTVARTAPEVDFAVFPGQFSGARFGPVGVMCWRPPMGGFTQRLETMTRHTGRRSSIASIQKRRP